MRDKIFNNIRNGSNFYIWATIKNLDNLISSNLIKSCIVYKINVIIDIEDSTITISSVVPQNGIYCKVFECVMTLVIDSVQEDILNALEEARNAARNVVGLQAFSVFDDGDVENPSARIIDLIDEHIISEIEYMQNYSYENEYMDKQNFCIDKLELADDLQVLLDRVFIYIMNNSISFIKNKRAFTIDIDYNTSIATGENVNAHSILDTVIVYNNILVYGMLSYYGDDNRIIGDKESSAMNIIENAEDFFMVLQNGMYSVIDMLYKITNKQLKISILIKSK